MAWRIAKAILTLRSEVNEQWPNRSKVSDGTLGDARHAARTSDHNPWVVDKDGVGVVRALDITAAGIDRDKYDEHLRLLGKHGDKRLNPAGYIISKGRIASSKNGWEWRPYTGSNAHDKHTHVSVTTSPAYDDAGPWGVERLTIVPGVATAAHPAAPGATHTFEEDDMVSQIVQLEHVGDDHWAGWWNPELGRDPVCVSATFNGPSLYGEDQPWPHLRDADPLGMQARGGEVRISTRLPHAIPGTPIHVHVTVA